MVAWQNGSGRERDDAPGGAAVRRRRLRNALIANCRGGDRRARQPVERAAADRERCPRQRDGEARGPGDLSTRPCRAAYPRDQQHRDRRSGAARPHRALRPGADADPMERQHPGLPDLRARSPAAWPAGARQGELGADRQAIAAAKRQAIPISRCDGRSGRHHRRPDKPLRGPGSCGRGCGQPHRRVQGPARRREPAAGSGQMPACRNAGVAGAGDSRAPPARRRPAQCCAIRLPAKPDRSGCTAPRNRHLVQRGVRQLRGQGTDGDSDADRRRQWPCRLQRQSDLHRQSRSGARRRQSRGPARSARQRSIADRTRLEGKYLLGAATGVVALVADYEANSAAARRRA